MIYRKPDNVTYVDMCIYIDNTAYTDSHDAQTIFEYLFHLVKHLAKEKRYFRRNEYYDDFGIFGATRAYMRLVNPKQFDDAYKMEPLKSILNYLNATIYPMKVDFEQSTYYQPVISESLDESALYNFSNLLCMHTDFTAKTAFDLMLEGIGPICNECIETIPYSGDKALKYNIITSIKLSFLNQLTLARSTQSYLNNLIKTNRINELHLNEAFGKKNNEVLLYHLPESFRDYILVLLRKTKAKVASELNETLSQQWVDPLLSDAIVINYRNEVEQINPYEYEQ